MRKKTIALLMLPILIWSCNDWDGPDPGSDTTVGATLYLNATYLGLYQKTHQFQELPIRIIVSVDNAKADGTLISNFDTFPKMVTNEFDSDNFEVDISVPQTGSFIITVTSEGTVCYDFCNNSSACTEFNKGKPYWREAKTFINTDNTPPPTSFYFFNGNAFVMCL